MTFGNSSRPGTCDQSLVTCQDESFDRFPCFEIGSKLARNVSYFERILGERPEFIYANTADCQTPLRFVQQLKVPVVAHIHELESTIISIGVDKLDEIVRKSEKVIAVANVVRDNLVQNHQVEPGRIEIVYEFIPTLPQLSGSHEERRQQLGRELGVDLPSDAVLICSMGTLHLRKGADLLVALAHSVFRRNSQSRPVHFLWIGGNPEDVPVFQAEAAQAGLSGQVHFIGQRREPLNLVDACDIFALLSREDPYPLVMLEAASLGKPIVCFDRSGGAIEFVEDDAGIAVPYLDVEAMAEGLSKLIESESLRTRLGENARNKACERHDVSVAAPRILSIIRSAFQASKKI